MRKYQNILLDPSQCAVLIIDHQPQMYFGVGYAHRCEIENNALGLAKSAQLFGVPCVLTTITAQNFGGPLYDKLQQIYPQVSPIDRMTINAWEDGNLKAVIEGTKRKKIILAGLWTEVCVAQPALSMVEDGFQVYVATDACGGMTRETHDMGILRMTQAGVTPLTWMQVLLEWQRDWNNKETSGGVMQIVKEHGGVYGLGVEYAERMVKEKQRA